VRTIFNKRFCQKNLYTKKVYWFFMLKVFHPL
jgi:hypothetical protein